MRKRQVSGLLTSPKGKRLRLSQNKVQQTNEFCLILEQCGFNLTTSNPIELKIEPNQLTCDQAIFIQKLRKYIKQDSRYPLTIDHFIDGMKEYLTSDNELLKLRKCLTFSVYYSNDDSSSQKQASLICNLLKLEELQTKVIDLLCEKYMELVSLDSEAQNIARLLISQFRWLDILVDSNKFCDQITELLQVSPKHLQGDVISLLPDVIPENHHNKIVTVLKELYEESDVLTAVILDTFIDLQLPTDVMTEVQESVIKTLPGADLKNQPIILKFLLGTSTDDNLLIEELRSNLDMTPVNSNPSTSKESTGVPHQYLTLEALRSALNLKKGLCDAMVKVYNNLKGSDVLTPLDILFLIVLHSVPNKNKNVITIIKSKLLGGELLVTVVGKTYKSFGDVLKLYSKEVLSLSEALLSKTAVQGVEFAAELFKHNFLVSDRVWQQQILGSLLTILGIGCQDNKTNVALNILSFFVHQHRDAILPFGAFFSILLDFIENFTLSQLRQMLDILSILAYGNQAAGIMHNDFEILITKHLANENIYYKKIGVIAALMAVKSIGLISCAEDSEPEESLEAATRLMDRTYQATWRHPTVQGLFLDQLSLLVCKNHILKEIKNDIGDLLISNFQDDFITDVEEVPSTIDEIRMVTKYGLDKNDSSGSIVLNLLPVICRSLSSEKENCPRKVDPVYLSSYLKFLVALEVSKNSTNLEEIDALLGCPVCLPSDDFCEDYHSLSHRERNLIFQSLYFVLNWFRECINGFCTQTDKEMISKVVTRLHNLVSIQNQLSRFLEKGDSPKVPSVVFDIDNRSKKSDKPTWPSKPVDDNVAGPSQHVRATMTTKRPKKLDAISQTGATQTKSKKEKAPVHKEVKFQVVYRTYLREFSMDVFCLLNNKVKLPMEISSGSATKLSTESLLLLLEDLHAKLKFSLQSNWRRLLDNNSSSGFSLLSLMEDFEVVESLLPAIEYLCVHLEDISRFIHEVEERELSQTSVNEIEEIEVAISCYKLLLHIFNLLLSWNGFKQHSHRGLFLSVLKIIAGRINSRPIENATLQQYSRHVFKYFLRCSKEFQPPNIECASLILKLLKTIQSCSDLKSLKLEICDVANKYLNHRWDRMDSNMSNALFNNSLEVILKAYLSFAAKEEDALEEIANMLLRAVKGGDEEESPCNETLKKSTFHVYYKCVFECLVTSLNPLWSCNLTRHSKLTKWRTAIELFQRLIFYIRSSDSRLSLGVALKQGKLFLECFIKHGMPVCDQLFKSDGAEVQKLIKALQVSTRLLQHVCNHSKVKKDVSLTTYVPTLRKSLETFVFRVKAMLAGNNCTEAFWLGNLKNRTLRGEEILTQRPVDEDEEQAQEEQGGGDDDSVSY